MDYSYGRQSTNFIDRINPSPFAGKTGMDWEGDLLIDKLKSFLQGTGAGLVAPIDDARLMALLLPPPKSQNQIPADIDPLVELSMPGAVYGKEGNPWAPEVRYNWDLAPWPVDPGIYR